MTQHSWKTECLYVMMLQKKRKKSFKHFLKFASSDVVVVGQIKHLVKEGKNVIMIKY